MPTVFVEPNQKAPRGSSLRRLLRRANIARLAIPLVALWKLLRHHATPTPAKATALATLAYTISPVDLIPDVVPIFGMLDDLTVISLGIAIAMRLTPKGLWQDRIAEAECTLSKVGPRIVWTAIILFTVWSLLLLGLAWWLGAAVVGR